VRATQGEPLRHCTYCGTWIGGLRCVCKRHADLLSLDNLAMTRRVPHSRSYTLRRIKATQRQVGRSEQELHRAVYEARAVNATWKEIGEALGISRQGAHKRFAA